MEEAVEQFLKVLGCETFQEYEELLARRHVWFCERHGEQKLVREWKSDGYAGVIYHFELSCGCVEVNLDHDGEKEAR